MSTVRLATFLLLAGAVAYGTSGCSADEGAGPTATGGMGAESSGGGGAVTGGTTGTGGSTGQTGGTTGQTGGATGQTGGTTGQTGGTTGQTGGSTGQTGGSTGQTGGTTGQTGGSGGDGTGGTATGGTAGTTGETLLFTWDSGDEDWTYNTYQTEAADDPDNMNRSDDAVLESVAEGDCGSTPGSLQVSIPLDAYTQKADIFVDLGEDSLVDLAGQVLFVRIQLVSGFNQDESAPGGIQFYIQTTNDWSYGEAEWQNVEIDSAGTWVEYTFDVSNPNYMGDEATYDPTQVRAIGIVFHTGDGPSGGAGGAGGAGSVGDLPIDAVFLIDCLGYRPG
jgi:hypothetical protein